MNQLQHGISVVIPAKNRASRLPACIESVINQTHESDEIIVIDDHSTDETKSIVLGFQKNRVRYVLNERTPGAQGARNQGIISAKYNWIAFQDSDDIWLPNKLEVQFCQLKNNNFKSDLVIHSDGYKILPEKNEKTQISQDTFEGNCFNKLLVKPGPLFPTIIAHKASLLDIGLLDEMCPSFQEWDTVIRLAKKNHFIHIRQPLFEWVCHNDETISKNLKRDVQGHFYVLNKNKENILNVHGLKMWLSVMTDLLCKAHRYGLIEEVKSVFSELPYTTQLLAKILFKTSWQIRGTGRLLHLSNKLFG